MLLTVDIGTTSLKSALWTFDGNREVFASYPVSAGNNNELDLNEVRTSLWLTAFEECCRKLGNQKLVEAIVISGHGPTLVPVSKDKTLPVRLWLDRGDVNRGDVKYQETVSELMGGFVDASFFLPRILGIKNDEGELYNDTKYFLGCPEYLAYSLTGNAKSVFPCDGFDRWFWNDDVLNKLNLDPSKFPAFIRPGDQFGTLQTQAAECYGFKKDIPVICGGPDFFAAILGSGVTKPGLVCDRTGSSEGLNLCLRNKVENNSFMSYSHPIKPWWNLSGIINTSGKAIEWGSNLLGIRSFEKFITLAQQSAPGSGGLIFHPYLAGDRTKLLDSFASWNGIKLSNTRAEFANSILEGICLTLKNILSKMEENNLSDKPLQLHVTGGLSDNPYLNQMKANITGLEVIEGIHKEGELLGLAIIGLCALGKYSSYEEASRALYRVKKRWVPVTSGVVTSGVVTSGVVTL